MFDHIRIAPVFPWNKPQAEVLRNLGPRITVEPDGTVRAMTAAEEREWCEVMERPVDCIRVSAPSNGRSLERWSNDPTNGALLKSSG